MIGDAFFTITPSRRMSRILKRHCMPIIDLINHKINENQSFLSLRHAKD